MTKQIIVNEKNFELPFDKTKYKTPYEDLAYAIVGWDNDAELKKQFQNNLEYATKLIQRGPEKDYEGFAYATSILANNSKEPLEIILQKIAPKSIGALLNSGTVIIKGNLGTETGKSMYGGQIFVEGNIAELYTPNKGLIYVSGNVDKLKLENSTYGGIVIVAGKIKDIEVKYLKEQEHMGMRTKFLFNSEDLKIKYNILKNNTHQFNRYEEKDITLKKSKVTNWNPDNFIENATQLCKLKLHSELDQIKKLLDKTKISELGKFYDTHLNGTYTGYENGYYQGTVNNLSNDDDY